MYKGKHYINRRSCANTGCVSYFDPDDADLLRNRFCGISHAKVELISALRACCDSLFQPQRGLWGGKATKQKQPAGSIGHRWLYVLETLHRETRAGIPCTQKWRALSAENPELSKLLTFKRGVGQKMALHASTTARNYVIVISAFSPFHSLLFPILFPPQGLKDVWHEAWIRL